MNSGFSFMALSIAIAILSLALFMTVAGATASSLNYEAIGIETDVDRRDGMGSRLPAYPRSNISQDEHLSLTEPISIYLPLLGHEYIDPAAERAALMALYNSTSGVGWYDSTGWGTDTQNCNWYGVTCDEHEHVTILWLGGNQLTGTLPSEIGNLPKLSGLWLYGTVHYCGMNPCEYYQLSGPVPPGIGNLVNLLSLDLSGNQLTSLPLEIGNLVNLQLLSLYGNQLTSLPPQIGNLASLLSLSLGNNQLTSIPPEIGNMTILQELSLSNNRLTSLPPEIGNLVKLQRLYLGGNRLASIPPEIGNLGSLQWLDLAGNQLSGLIPAFLSNLGNLSTLSLEGNPDLTCWETQEARDWALSLDNYDGPACYIP